MLKNPLPIMPRPILGTKSGIHGKLYLLPSDVASGDILSNIELSMPSTEAITKIK
jgi:hypothetical protein